ncbi:hypothetical protein PYJP_12290 [Pyrofollis japonicus]|nr:hypothetical protein PYJP_12290 [Pyrofollis japonicus]
MREMLKRLGQSINPDLEYHVLGSGISSSLDKYTAWYLLVFLLLVLLVPSMVAALLYARGFPLLVSIVVGIGLAVSTALIGIALYVMIPALIYQSRGSKLEPRFLSLASALSTRILAGSGIAEAFIQVWREEREELKEFSIELEYISSMIKAGVPVDEALSRAAKVSPSPSVKSLLGSLAAAARTGSNVEEIINTIVSEYIHTTESYVENLSSSLGALLEIFVAFGAMLPVAIGVVALLFAIQPPRTPLLSFDNILFISTFIVVPATSAAIAVLADSMVTRIRV